MSNSRILAGVAATLGVGAIAVFALVSNGVHTDALAQAEDTDGPNLVIEVGGATTGTIVIDLRPDVAPNHVAQIVALAGAGAYDNVMFHRVITGFMAQTGDVEFGKVGSDVTLAGRGGSQLPDIAAEFSSLPFDAGVVGMARSNDPNSANSQFFITFAPAPHLNGQYTVVGAVIEGMDVINALRKGDDAQNGLVGEPDFMAKVTVRD